MGTIEKPESPGTGMLHAKRKSAIKRANGSAAALRLLEALRASAGTPAAANSEASAKTAESAQPVISASESRAQRRARTRLLRKLRRQR